MEAVDIEKVDFKKIGGRILVIFLATRHTCVVIHDNIGKHEGYRTYRHITRATNV